MNSSSIYITALAASTVWFGLGFHFFGIRRETAAKVLIPRSARSSPLFLTMTASVRFLGGMNAALAALSAALLLLALTQSGLFADPLERALLLFVLGGAHFSQFAANIPVLRNGERQGEAYWPVLSGTMRTIFFVDAAQAVLHLTAAVSQVA